MRRRSSFGCGTGTTALKLAPSLGRIMATDISGEMIAIAREKARAEGCGNATFELRDG
jgi:ubiquinone/menaquinone biosynthesis C-methylase UbiE